MSARYFIENGKTISPIMPLDWSGCLVSFLFFDAGGLPAQVSGLPVVSQSLYEAGSIFKAVQPLSNGEWVFNGPASRIKIDLSGVTGFSSYRVIIWRTDEPMPMIPGGVFSGDRAMMIQSYNEANVKRGLQFFTRIAWPTSSPIANGPAAARKIRFATGAKPVLFKGRVFDYIGEELTIQLYESPTGVTGGTAVTPRNFNRINPAASTVQITRDVTTVTDGVTIDDLEYFFGSTNAPQRQASSIPAGRERVLKPNTVYLIVITSVVGTARAQYFGDWFEGDPDLPIKNQ